MNQTTKKQHYIWRTYLAPWTVDNSNTGTIMCLRGDRIFPVSLMKIASENCFYGVKELTPIERNLIYEMAIKKTEGAQREANEGCLSLYCAAFDYVDWMVSKSYSIWDQTGRIIIRENQEFKNWNIEQIEKLHGIIEDDGMEFLLSLRKNDLSFWKDDTMRDRFSFFLANQYFRTKKSRDAILTSFEIAKAKLNAFKDIRPENMWIPLSLIYASNVGVYISQVFSPVLLQTDNYFIVGDQPVINTKSTFDPDIPPEDVEFFYPITPNCALLLTANRKYSSGETIRISTNETSAYNQMEKRAAHEQIFAKEESQLIAFLNS